MEDIVLSEGSIDGLNEGGRRYECVGGFVSNYIHERERVEDVIVAEVERRGCQGLMEIQREPIPTYREENGRLILNGESYLVTGRLVRRVG